jgi:hypothetical protein
VVFGVVYPLYDASRWVLAGRFPTASAHARWVIALERSMGFAFERSVQRVFEAGPAEWLLSNVYLAAQLVVLPGSLIWLYRRSPRVYRRLRDTVVAAWLMAVPIFALFPVAPPRLAGVGMLDTVSHHAAVALTGRSTIFYNPYAAVPSLHVGLAFAIGIAARATFRARWARALALMWGPLVAVSVIATGSHYVFDVAAGLVVTGLAHAAGSADPPPAAPASPRAAAPAQARPRRRGHERHAAVAGGCRISRCRRRGRRGSTHDCRGGRCRSRRRRGPAPGRGGGDRRQRDCYA